MDIGEEITVSKFTDEYHRATINVIFTANWLTNVLEERARAHDVTLHQFNVLRILRGRHPEASTNNQIRERMVERKSDVSRIVNRLVSKGLIHRSKCEWDGRAVALTITEQGLQVLEQLEEPMLLADILPHRLTTEECKQLNTLLNKMRG